MMFATRACALLFAIVVSSAVAAPQAHMVFFTLAEPIDASADLLVEKCHEHLSDHEGVIHFSVGKIAKDLSREVNDKTFDVALHVVFADRAAHDTYQTHPRHLLFITEAKSLWSKVRVFDSDLIEGPKETDSGKTDQP
ncbi:MAG: Dabb family protein [Planctomycetota bacterium]